MLRACLAVVLLSGCTLVIGIKEPTLVEEETPEGRVAGRVAGMWTGTSVALRLEATGAEPEILNVTASGSFEFLTALEPGTGYTVAIAAQPAAHTCSVVGAGTVGDGGSVEVACEGPGVTIQLVEPAGFAFARGTFTYDLAQSAIIQRQAVRVTGADLEVTLDDVALAPGTWSPPIALGLEPVVSSVRVRTQGLEATYQITFRRGARRAEQRYGKASTVAAGDAFGTSIAISGDTLVVGAPSEDSTATGSGAVYVFRRAGGGWVEEAKLKASNPDMTDTFGGSVAIDGDTIAVGARNEASNVGGVVAGNYTANNNDQPASGAVYVFRRNGTIWTQEAYVKSKNTDDGDYFGWSVALSGDLLAVGAINEDSGTSGIDTTPDESKLDSGAVYVLRRTGTVWAHEAYLKASNTSFGDNFGDTVAVSGDTVAVGVRDEQSGIAGIDPVGGEADDSADRAGAVYVFRRTSGTWDQEAYIKASNAETLDNFGASIALDGETLVVGALGESGAADGVTSPVVGDPDDDSVQYSGAAYVFERSGTTWTQTFKIKAANAGATHFFGSSVAVHGDVLAIGAAGESGAQSGPSLAAPSVVDDSEMYSGAVYLFRRSATTWEPSGYLKATNVQADDQVGFHLAVSADCVAVGVDREDGLVTGFPPTQPAIGEPTTTATDSGAVYLFH